MSLMRGMRSENEESSNIKDKKEINTKKENKIAHFLKGIKTELPLITWPKREEVVKSTTTVIVFSVIVSACILAADYIFKFGFDKFILNQ